MVNISSSDRFKKKMKKKKKKTKKKRGGGRGGHAQCTSVGGEKGAPGVTTGAGQSQEVSGEENKEIYYLLSKAFRTPLMVSVAMVAMVAAAAASVVTVMTVLDDASN